MKYKYIPLLIGLAFGLKNVKAQTDTTTTAEEKQPNWEKTVALGTSFSHTLNINPPNNEPKQAMQLTFGLELEANYVKESSKLHVANNLNWLFTFGKADARSRTLASLDQVLTFHDVSYAFKRKGDWNINTIVKTENHFFTTYEGNFLKDYYQLGRIQSFLNPYTLTVSPGIKYEPQPKLGFSFSPYAFEVIGLTNQFIADKGQVIEERRVDGHYETFLFRPLGTELNVWWKKKLGKRFVIDYKYDVSYNFFTNSAVKGQMGGFFVTSFNIFKGLSLKHTAKLNGVMEKGIAFKPYYNQVILLSYKLSL